MGFIRKTLALSTAGVIRPSSKKQRVAKKSLRQLQQQTALLSQIHQVQPVPAPIPTASPIPAPAGWYPDQTDPRRVRWFDGRVWTEHIQPRQ